MFRVTTGRGDEVWRIKVDDCLIQDLSVRRVDYAFCVRCSASGEALLLVELKGRDVKHALEQIQSTLRWLRQHGHEMPARKLAYVISSNGNQVPQCLDLRERIRKEYHVIVTIKTRQLEVSCPF